MRWAATNMTHVTIDEVSVFESRPSQYFQTSGMSDVVGRAKWRRWQGQLGAPASEHRTAPAERKEDR